MADGLDAYRAKRDFDATPEPAGEQPTREDQLRFVVAANGMEVGMSQSTRLKIEKVK